jgi:hypothetical protein
VGTLHLAVNVLTVLQQSCQTVLEDDPYLGYTDSEDHLLSILAEPMVQSVINLPQ